MPICGVCSLATASINALRVHYEIGHNVLVNDQYGFSCKEADCFRDFTQWKNYRAHLIHTHRCPVSATSAPLVHVPPPIVLGNTDAMALDNLDPYNIAHSVPPIDSHTVQPKPLSFVIRKHAADFCGELYANRSLCRSYVDSIVQSTGNLTANVAMAIKDAVVDELRQNNISESVVNKVESLIDHANDTFQGLSSEHLRTKYMKGNAMIVEPQSYRMGSRNKQGRNSFLPNQPVTGQYIPLKDLRFQFFSKPRVLDNILDYMESLNIGGNNEVVTNFVQGKYWSSKIALLRKDGYHIPLEFFFRCVRNQQCSRSPCQVGQTGWVLPINACVTP